MPRYFGPFQITAIINPVAYTLALPEYFGRTHNVFHVSLLEPFISDGQNRTPPAPVQAAGKGIEEEWLVEGIIDHRKVDARSVLTKGGIDPSLGAPILLSTHHKKLNTE